MRERLIQLFDGLANPDQLQLILESCEVLEGINYRYHEDAIEQFFTLPDSQTGEAVFAVTEKILAPVFREYIQAMGVRVAENVSLNQLKDLLFWLHFIPNYEDQDVVHQLATPDESAEDTLIDILSVVSALPEDYFSPMIDGVSSSLIVRIGELSDGHEVVELPDPTDFQRARARLIRYTGWLKDQHAKLAQGIDLADLRLGLSAELTLARHRDELEALGARDCAMMLLFYLFGSDAPDESILPIASNEVEVLFEDFLKGVEVMRHCKSIMEQLNHA